MIRIVMIMVIGLFCFSCCCCWRWILPRRNNDIGLYRGEDYVHKRVQEPLNYPCGYSGASSSILVDGHDEWGWKMISKSKAGQIIV